MWITQEPKKVALWNKRHFEEKKRGVCRMLNPLSRIFFLIVAHYVYKMWITQELKKVALWNKRLFEEKKRRVCSMFKIFCKYICWIIYKMQHLEVSGAVRHIYMYVVRQLRVNYEVIRVWHQDFLLTCVEELKRLSSSWCAYRRSYAAYVGTYITNSLKYRVIHKSLRDFRTRLCNN